MGYIRHHAILVTSHDERHLKVARANAVMFLGTYSPAGPSSAGESGEDWRGLVSPAIKSVRNGYWSFFVAPDGGKEGWEGSDLGVLRRGRFIDWLNSTRHRDGSSSIQWAEVQYGDDNGVTAVTAHSDEDPASKERVKVTSQAKALALAVLEGDEDAALLLADLVHEGHLKGGV